MAAARLHHRACQLDAQACGRLGEAYWYGRGVARNELHAVWAFRRSCDAGSMLDCERLARVYLRGDGVNRDRGYGRTLARLACAAGRPNACAMLARDDHEAAYRRSYQAQAMRRSGTEGARTGLQKGCALGLWTACKAGFQLQLQNPDFDRQQP
jgi:TPR repeat protein